MPGLRIPAWLLFGLALGAAACGTSDPPGFFDTATDTNPDDGDDGDDDDDDDDDGTGDGGGDDAGATDATDGTDATDSAIAPDCGDCVGEGLTVENLACAFELCDGALISLNELVSATGSDIDEARAAVTRFGAETNGLAPRVGPSYVLLATGPATGTSHSLDLGGSPITDPFSGSSTANVYNAVDWRLTLTAPPSARAFRFRSVFLSTEFDEYVGSTFMDRFYAILQAPSTNGGVATIINFAACRDPAGVTDFTCADEALGCEAGQPYCYVSIASALAECCWYDGCSTAASNTSLLGTGYVCAANQIADSATRGSSTGWLMTSWPIDGGETFTLTFHIHDTADAIYDSEVILDGFEFLTEPAQGTVRLDD